MGAGYWPLRIMRQFLRPMR
ncbi:hypothetical protein A2U01_0100175, partial [Trifolium medium]|nr:hypothetical protein [Trifolium medium]